jgi:hypothetical protein
MDAGSIWSADAQDDSMWILLSLFSMLEFSQFSMPEIFNAGTGRE